MCVAGTVGQPRLPPELGSSQMARGSRKDRPTEAARFCSGGRGPEALFSFASLSICLSVPLKHSQLTHLCLCLFPPGTSLSGTSWWPPLSV